MTDPQDVRRALSAALEALDEEDRMAEGSRETVALDQQSVGRLSRMDALQQQAMARATHARRIRERARLIAALARLDAGEYGFCADCGAEIEPRRLALDPAAPLCLSAPGGDRGRGARAARATDVQKE